MNFVSTDLPWQEILLRLGVATLIGCALGLNREIARKPAGMRTHALVALGTALVTLTGMVLAGQDGEFDSNSVSRVIQGIVAGIGFLGGGTILKSDTGEQISGLTTAASLWVTGAIGVAVGLGSSAKAVDPDGELRRSRQDGPPCVETPSSRRRRR